MSTVRSSRPDPARPYQVTSARHLELICPTWLGSALVAVAAIAGYLLTRSVSLPFDRDDVGNWLEPLGLVALFIEVGAPALGGYPLTRSSYVGADEAN